MTAVANTELSALPRAHTLNGAELMAGIQSNTAVQILPIDLAVFMTDILLSNSEFAGLINKIYADFAANTGAELVGTESGVSVQSELDLKMDISRLNANSGATLIRTANGELLQDYLNDVVSNNATVIIANNALNLANSAYLLANNALAVANLAYARANTAFINANTAIINANTAQATANLAYAAANGAQYTANQAFVTIGVPKDSSNMGSFSGSTIGDNETIKQALQDLENSVEGKQPLDAQLSALAALSPGTNQIPYFTNSTTMTLASLSGFLSTIGGQQALTITTNSYGTAVGINIGGTTYYFQMAQGYNVTVEATQVITWPVTFTTACTWSLVGPNISHADTSTDYWFQVVGTPTTTGITVQCQRGSGTAGIGVYPSVIGFGY